MPSVTAMVEEIGQVLWHSKTVFWSQFSLTRRAPSSYKWSYNPYKQGYNPSNPLLRPFIGTITPSITSMGPPCTTLPHLFHEGSRALVVVHRYPGWDGHFEHLQKRRGANRDKLRIFHHPGCKPEIFFWVSLFTTPHRINVWLAYYFPLYRLYSNPIRLRYMDPR